MDTFLTLVIALGGIATGIGAIWAALITRRQAQVTERSLAQTERGLAEQAQILREQNERARLSLEVDLMYKLEERWDSQRFWNIRKRHVTYLKENCFVDDRIVGVEHLDAATEQILDFFEEVGYLTRTGVLRLEHVWYRWKRSPNGLGVVRTRYEEVAQREGAIREYTKSWRIFSARWPTSSARELVGTSPLPKKSYASSSNETCTTLGLWREKGPSQTRRNPQRGEPPRVGMPRTS